MRWLVLAALLASACGFDESGAAGSSGSGGVGGVGGSGGGGTGGGGTGGSFSCTSGCTTITGQIRVGGTVWTSDTQPATFRIVGDNLSLDTTQVCVPSGQPAFTWSVAPQNGTAQTLSPSANAAAITLYATDPAEYHVTLNISDPRCPNVTPLSLTVWALTALGPQPVGLNNAGAAVNTINDISAGGGYLWTATGAGAWRITLAPPHTPWQDVQSVFDQGAGVPSANLGSVFYDGPDNVVFYGPLMANADVGKVNLAGNSIDLVDVAANANGNAIAYEFSRLPGNNPVYAATDHGLLSWTAGTTAFANRQTAGADDNFFTLVQGQNIFWVGGPALYNFTATSPTGQDLFPGGDDKIRALALDSTNLWVGSDGLGLGRASSSTGVLAEVLDSSMMTPASKRLPGSKIRDIAVEPPDVWIATDQGVARYKEDVGAVVTYKSVSAGMALSGGQLDTRAIVVDRSTGVRRVFIGTANGVLVLETP